MNNDRAPRTQLLETEKLNPKIDGEPIPIVEEPAIVQYGRSRINNYPEQEYRDSLLRAFGGYDPADFLILDSNPRGQGFTSAGIAWAIDKGFLYCDRCANGDQEQVATFRLTDQGKKEFKLNGKV